MVLGWPGVYSWRAEIGNWQFRCPRPRLSSRAGRWNPLGIINRIVFQELIGQNKAPGSEFLEGKGELEKGCVYPSFAHSLFGPFGLFGISAYHFSVPRLFDQMYREEGLGTLYIRFHSCDLGQLQCVRPVVGSPTSKRDF